MARRGVAGPGGGRRTGFLDCFTHADGATPRSRELKRNLLAVLVAQAQSESIGLFGIITVDIDAELAQLGPTGHRPLRQPRGVTVTP